MIPAPNLDQGDLRADHLQFIIDAIPLLVSYVDADQRYVFNNRTYQQWFGETAAALRGRRVADVIGEDAYAAVGPHIERALAGESSEFEGRMRIGDHWRDVHVTYIPDRAPTGEVSGFMAVISDITAHKHAEARVRESAAFESTLNRVGSVLAGELDVHRIVQAVTDAATTIVGAQFGAFFYNVLNDKGESYTLYTLSGVPRDAFDTFPMPRNTKVFDPTFKGTGILRSDDITQDSRYGQNPPYYGMPKGHLPVRSYLAVPVLSRSGETLGGLFFGHAEPARFGAREEALVSALATQASIAVDNARLVEELRRRTAQAEEASHLKDEFLSIASHELRTPLNAILGWTRMVRSGALKADDIERALDVIERNAKLQAQLVEDLLEISRISSGKLRLDLRPTNLSYVITSALDAVRPTAAAKDVRLEAVTAGLDSGVVMADPDRLQQVVWNVVSNAVKFTPQAGCVTVELRRDGDAMEMVVADTGIGIAPEFLPYVFDRFRQGDTGHARQFGGLGLGLAISRHLVELHGGTIVAESRGRNLGATFRVRLPVTSAAESHVRAPAPDVPPFCVPDALAGVSVLVVDDEDDARELLRTVLSGCGACVAVAASAREALVELDARPPDVLLSDIGMPGESGYMLIEEIRRRPADRSGQVPAAALTAYASNQDRTMALRSGFDLHVPKPADPAEVIAVVQSLARRRR